MLNKGLLALAVILSSQKVKGLTTASDKQDNGDLTEALNKPLSGIPDESNMKRKDKDIKGTPPNNDEAETNPDEADTDTVIAATPDPETPAPAPEEPATQKPATVPADSCSTDGVAVTHVDDNGNVDVSAGLDECMSNPVGSYYIAMKVSCASEGYGMKIKEYTTGDCDEAGGTTYFYTGEPAFASDYEYFQKDGFKVCENVCDADDESNTADDNGSDIEEWEESEEDESEDASDAVDEDDECSTDDVAITGVFDGIAGSAQLDECFIDPRDGKNNSSIKVTCDSHYKPGIITITFTEYQDTDCEEEKGVYFHIDEEQDWQRTQYYEQFKSKGFKVCENACDVDDDERNTTDEESEESEEDESEDESESRRL